MTDGVHFHLVGIGTLAGKDVLPLQIAVHHHNDGGIVIHFPDDAGDSLYAGDFRCVVPAMAGDNLITPIGVWPHQQRGSYAIFPNALRRFLHFLIVPHLKRMSLKFMQLPDGNPLHLLHHFICHYSNNTSLTNSCLAVPMAVLRS